jgi:hypothetical protein
MPGDKVVLYLLVIPLAASFIAEWSGVIQSFKFWLFYRKYTKKTPYRDIYSLKPFSCPMCLSFWLASVSLTWTYSDLSSLFYPFASAGAAVVINKIINK